MISASLACQSKVSVWACLISADYKPIGANEKLQMLLALALHIAALDMLHIDSRVLNWYCQEQEGGKSIIFCLYDTSGGAGYVSDLSQHSKELLTSALERLKMCGVASNREKYLLNYANERMLARMTEDDFECAAKWAAQTRRAMVDGLYNSIMCSGQKLEVSPVASNVLFDTPNAKITLLVNEWNPELLSANGVVGRLVSRENVSKVDVVIGTLGNEIEPIKIAWRNEIAACVKHDAKLSVYEEDFESTGLVALYDGGLCLKVNDDWYIEDSTDGNCKVISVPFNEKNTNRLYRVVKGIDIGLDLTEEKKVKQMNVSADYIKPAVSAKGALYSSLTILDIWTRLGVSAEQKVKSATIIDNYVWTPVNWKVLFMLMYPLKLGQDTTIKIITWDPAAASVAKGKAPKYFRLFSDIDAINCRQPINLPLAKADADIFADHIRKKLHIASVDIDYQPEKPNHDRIITIIFDDDGKDKVVRFQFGKGLAFLNYANADTQKLFSSNADAVAFYPDMTVFCRIDQ